ncbi:MAG: cysteine hydrolase family protein [Methanoregulaceae archaeon]
MKDALCVIDVQNEYFTGKLPVTFPEGSFRNILLAMDIAIEKEIPVIVVRHVNPDPYAPTFARGGRGATLHDEILRRHRDFLIEKQLPGSFTGTGLEAGLRSRGIDTITICGYMTQMCCDTTARQGFHLGFSVNFLSDATGTLAISNPAGSISAEDLHRAILITQAMRFSRVIPTAQWVEEIPAQVPG